MPTSESQKKASLKYAKTHLKRVPLDLTHEKYDQVKQSADTVGESVNGFIKKSIDERIERIASEPKH